MKGSSVLKFFLVLMAVVFLGNQIISSVYKPIKTDSAVFHTTQDGLKITGVIMRKESLVKYEGSGVMHFVTADGNRVAKNGVIANIYDSESASITVTEIESIKKKITDIEDILSYNDIEAANLDLILKRVEEKVNELILSTSTGNYSGVTACADDLLSAINRKQAALGEAVDFSSQLNVLNNRLAELNASLPTVKGKVLAEQSGYFVSKTDGYEQAFDVTELGALTPEFMDGVTAKTYDNAVIGKIVSDYEWYIAATVSLNQSLNYKEGEALKIATAIKSAPELNVTVKKINISQDSSNAVIIFACNEMNSELASLRNGPMTVVKAEYSGLKVPRSALRVVDGQRGVYVLSGMQIKFVPVDVVYYTDSYIICKKDSESILKLYDRVVVKGKNLYDGKIDG